MKQPHPFFLFVQLSRPWFLAAGVLFYALGVGMARYLGHPLVWGVVLNGQIWVSALQLCVHYLNEYFDHGEDAGHPQRTLFSGGSGVLGQGAGQLRPQVALIAAGSLLAVLAVATHALLRSGQLNLTVGVLLALILFGALSYSVPPLRLATSGYGELSTAILLAALVPALGFTLQSGAMHRLLGLSTFPLVALTLAAMLALEFADYAQDLKVGKLTLLVRAGWEQGLRLHHALLAAGYALLLGALTAGLPAAIGSMALFSLPLAGLQVWYLQRIAQGLKPNWLALTFNGVAIPFLTAYLLAQGFWLR
ncbi:MAG: prenyltransferase [Anaerolineales bacterium]|nr:prenyltransferase [Anaerolineales bacterium]MCW5838648.1 prenyltransferase [Anaerolineales bacterium]